MWSFTSLTFTGGDKDKVYCCDGTPILNTVRGPEGAFYRIVVGDSGYLDIRDTGHQEGGPHYWTLLINNTYRFWYDGQAALSLEVSTEGAFRISSTEGYEVSGALWPLPEIAGTTISAFKEMISMQIVPYQNPPSGTPKNTEEIKTLADNYYPGDPFGYDKAMCLYDWTSASFIRQDLFNQLQYTNVTGAPLDLNTMARVIWGCNYPGYTAKDPHFMNAFTMQPATSEADVYSQLQGVYEKIKPLAIAEMNLQVRSLLSLPNPSVVEYPVLYRGAMPMSGGYDTSDFAPSMFECPLNSSTDSPLVESLKDAIEGTLAVGQVITTKGPWSFSNDLDGAKVWQNGILITCLPPEEASLWPACADITAFSLNPGTFEINVPPRTRYRIEKIEWMTIQDKPVCHFTMTMLGYSVGPFTS